MGGRRLVPRRWGSILWWRSCRGTGAARQRCAGPGELRCARFAARPRRARQGPIAPATPARRSSSSTHTVAKPRCRELRRSGWLGVCLGRWLPRLETARRRPRALSRPRVQRRCFPLREPTLLLFRRVRRRQDRSTRWRDGCARSLFGRDVSSRSSGATRHIDSGLGRHSGRLPRPRLARRRSTPRSRDQRLQRSTRATFSSDPHARRKDSRDDRIWS